MKNYTEIAINTIKEAGKILMKHYGNVEVKYQDEFYDMVSIITEADLESEKKILENITKNFPEHNIYSEEAGMNKKNSDYTWYVDPLDGTSNFSRNIPLFGISIGLVKEDKPIMGVLYFPALDLLVHGEKGKGAFANGRKIKVSDREMKKALYYSGGMFRRQMQLEEKVAKEAGLTKIIDASSYEFAQIAMGDAELYILANVPHDVVAGTIIVQEAGGRVTDFKGKNYHIKSEGIVASNKKIHNQTIKLLGNRK